MGRREDLQKRHEKLSNQRGIPTDTERPPVSSPGVARQVVVKVAPAVVILTLLVVGVMVWLQTRTGDTDTDLSAVGEKYSEAVGLVVASVPTDEGPRIVPVATAWGYKPDLAATNAHVAAQIRELIAGGAEVAIVVNGRPGIRLPVTGAVPHNGYREGSGESDADVKVPFAFDVALLAIDGEFPVNFPIASAEELAKLKSGYRIAYLGFPMENLLNGNVNAESPVANMQSGIVTAVTDFEQRDAGGTRNYLVRHNLGVTGGASGSPMFNTKGEVVAIVNGMNITAQLLPTHDGRMAAVRAPSAAMINFAQRVDLLTEIEAGRESTIEAVQSMANRKDAAIPQDGTVKADNVKQIHAYENKNEVTQWDGQ